MIIIRTVNETKCSFIIIFESALCFNEEVRYQNMRLDPAQLIHWLPCSLIFCAWTVAFQIKHREGIITTKCINYGSFNVFTAFPIPDPWSKGFNAFRKSSQNPLVHDKVYTGIELLRQFILFLFFCLKITFVFWLLNTEVTSV